MKISISKSLIFLTACSLSLAIVNLKSIQAADKPSLATDTISGNVPTQNRAGSIACIAKQSNLPYDLKRIFPDLYCCNITNNEECLEENLISLTGVAKALRTRYNILDGFLFELNSPNVSYATVPLSYVCQTLPPFPIFPSSYDLTQKIAAMVQEIKATNEGYSNCVHTLRVKAGEDNVTHVTVDPHE